MYTLAIDLGASFIKFGLFRQLDGKLLLSSRSAFPGFNDCFGQRREVSTHAIIDIVKEGIQKITASIQERVDLLFSTQMQGFVLVDPLSHEPLTNFISWQDLRSCFYWNEIDQFLDEPLLSSIGRELKPGHAITTLYALKKAGDLPTRSIILSLGDYIALKITGRVPTLHSTNASSFGCWEIRNNQWAKSFINALGLGDVQFPEAASQLQAIEYDHRRRFLGCWGDFQVSLLGAGLESPNVCSINIATGSQVSRICSEVPEEFSCQIRPYFNQTFLKTVTHLPAGRAINFILKPFLAAEQIDLEQAFESVDKDRDCRTNLEVNLNVFPTSLGYGGAIGNIREDNLSSKNILLACIDTISSNCERGRELVDANHECTRILGSGGILTKCRRLQDSLSRGLNLPIEFADDPEDALTGLLKISRFYT
jgi:FGGY family of carbohydrate kinases, N-terminal domain